jgi:hypothetical protein
VSSARTLTGFAVALAALFGLGALLGGMTGATAPGGDVASGDEMAGGHAGMAEVHGLGVAEGGLRLVVDTPQLHRGHAAQLRFRIVDDQGATVRGFDTEHTKRMHLIVVRRDLTGFQHLHPAQSRDGGWSTRLTLPEAGSYRVFADFSHAGAKTTLASDLRVDGSADLRALPSPAATSDPRTSNPTTTDLRTTEPPASDAWRA